ncbi:MAG: HNH endonuclease [Candidatus Sumerlaeia bacterium]|nr:HNH endonuclease [Candidatus Sumerlaeia bacterium]
MDASALLNQSVLVLNRNWIAVHICDARRALVMLYQDLARAVTENYETLNFDSWRALSQAAADHEVIHTPRYPLMVPQVIKLVVYNRFPPLHVRFSRRNIYHRDHYQCQYCGAKPPHEEMTIDHIVPRSRGGKTCWENVVLACSACNARKGNRMLAECRMSLIRKPRKPHWLLGSRPDVTPDTRPLWQKFIDEAYWNVALEE